jgi:hypothetical protein
MTAKQDRDGGWGWVVGAEGSREGGRAAEGVTSGIHPSLQGTNFSLLRYISSSGARTRRWAAIQSGSTGSITLSHEDGGQGLTAKQDTIGWGFMGARYPTARDRATECLAQIPRAIHVESNHLYRW